MAARFFKGLNKTSGSSNLILILINAKYHSIYYIVIDYIMRTALEGNDLGHTLHPRRSRRYPAVKITVNADFADDLALLTDSVAEAQKFLDSLEHAANSIGLHLNEDITKYMGINIKDDDKQNITAAIGESIKKVQDFVYLGSRTSNTEKDFIVRKAEAWAACHQMKKIWKSDMCRDLKIRLFVVTVESILLYGVEAWTISQTMFFFFLTCLRPTSASGKLDGPLTFQGASGHLD